MSKLVKNTTYGPVVIRPKDTCKARELLKHGGACFRKINGQMTYKVIRHDALPYISGDRDNKFPVDPDKVYGVNIDNGGLTVIDADKEVTPIFISHTATVLKNGEVFCPTCGSYRFSTDPSPRQLLERAGTILDGLMSQQAMEDEYGQTLLLDDIRKHLRENP